MWHGLIIFDMVVCGIVVLGWALGGLRPPRG